MGTLGVAYPSSWKAMPKVSELARILKLILVILTGDPFSGLIYGAISLITNL